MFDIATRALSATQAAATGVFFDWRLVPPGPASSFTWTDFSDPSGQPQVYVDLLEVYGLELEPTFVSAINISIFTDARAESDDVLPAGTTSLRGWVGEEFVSPDPERPEVWGCRLWLRYFTKCDPVEAPTVREAARFDLMQALQWMVKTGMASKVEVEAEWDNDRLLLRPKVWRPGNPQPVYDRLWAVSIQKGAA